MSLSQSADESTEEIRGVWVDVARRDALDPDFPLGVDAHGHKIGLFLFADEVCTLEDVCPHAYALLSQGFAEDGVIECPLHAARFEMVTGRCLNEIGQRDLKRFPVRVVAGRVEIEVPLAGNDE